MKATTYTWDWLCHLVDDGALLHETSHLDNTAKIIRRFWLSTNAVILFAE